MSSQKLRSLTKKIPGYDPWKHDGGYYFDYAAARLAIEFFEECIRHVKGSLAGEKIKLEDWQKAILANLFGWKRKIDGLRRYRESIVYVPRKNGKTTIMAGMVLFMLFCDGEAGAEIYSAAFEREQAALVYDPAKAMLLADDYLSKMGRVFPSYKSITYQATNSSYKALSAEVESKHGFNSHFVVVDELHTQKKPDLVEALLTSTGSRKQPLVVHITTADFAGPSICNQKYDYACKVRDGIIEDPAFFPVIYEASKDDDWTSKKVWKRANPNYGISLFEEYLERECKRAQNSPAYENTFKRLHLNIQTEQDVRWLQMENWDACGEVFNEKELHDKPCLAGLDLASTIDIAAFVLYFPEYGHKVLPFFWVPKDRIKEREDRDRVPYRVWEREGYLETTPGNSIDYRYIRQRINELSNKYALQEIAFDPWNATQLATQLAEEDGFEMIKFRQGFVTMNEPAKHLETLILKKKLRHGANPVLRWMASNVTVKTDPSGNIRFDKEKSVEKIDGIVALAMAIGRAMVAVSPTSVYDTRGLLTV